jgi:hypothetical protein
LEACARKENGSVPDSPVGQEAEKQPAPKIVNAHTQRKHPKLQGDGKEIILYQR